MNLPITHLLAILCVFGCVSCLEQVHEREIEPDKVLTSTVDYKDEDRDTFYLPLDTMVILQQMNIALSKSLPGLVDSLGLDTFYLNYVAYACNCQHWVVSKDYDDTVSTFDLGESGYFIHAYNQDVELDERLWAFNNRVRFIGKSHVDNTYQTDSDITVKKQILIYYAYEVILPSKIYGPLYHTGLREIPSAEAEMINLSVLEIKDKLQPI